ncbi:MAG: cytochrome c oxidase subunit II [Actinobacteria bacterium]|nr:cytochrome c oxidase subunit II [Actinomycetota bacterium]
MTDTLTTAPADAPGGPPTVPAWKRAPIAPILGIFVVLCALLTPFALFVPAHLMGDAASAHMRGIESTVTAFSLASVPVAALVWAVTIYSIIGWRHRGSEPPAEEAPPLRGNTVVQVVWLVLSSVLCLFLLIWGLAVLRPTPSAASAGQPLMVEVTGQQWTWSFGYPDNGNATADRLVLPVNQPVQFRVTSKDVIHSFWIVQMGVKVDANPGETTLASVTPDRIGTFDIRCAELCGLYHAYMQTTVQVVSADQFASWVQAQPRATS